MHTAGQLRGCLCMRFTLATMISVTAILHKGVSVVEGLAANCVLDSTSCPTHTVLCALCGTQNLANIICLVMVCIPLYVTYLHTVLCLVFPSQH